MEKAFVIYIDTKELLYAILGALRHLEIMSYLTHEPLSINAKYAEMLERGNKRIILTIIPYLGSNASVVSLPQAVKRIYANNFWKTLFPYCSMAKSRHMLVTAYFSFSLRA